MVGTRSVFRYLDAQGTKYIDVLIRLRLGQDQVDHGDEGSEEGDEKPPEPAKPKGSM